MRAAALESGRRAPVRHVSALVAKEKTSRRVPSARLPPAVPLHLELTCSLVQNAKNNGVLGPFLPPVSLQPFAAPS